MAIQAESRISVLETPELFERLREQVADAIDAIKAQLDTDAKSRVVPALPFEITGDATAGIAHKMKLKLLSELSSVRTILKSAAAHA